MTPFDPPAADALRAARRAHTWWLLAIWLAWSAAALGWHLANDPLLSTYTYCGRR